MSNVAREVLPMDSGTPMRHRFRSRAFTLVEVMIVVAMIGVLAALAIVSFRKYVKSSKVSEPIYVMQGIRAAEESYRSETMTYLDVTQSGAYYPRSGSFDWNKFGWGAGNDVTSNNWRTLGVVTDGAVRFGYKCNAGSAGVQVNAGILDPSFTWGNGSAPVFPTPPTEPWYIVQAKGDPDRDPMGPATLTPVLMLGNSFSGDLYWEGD